MTGEILPRMTGEILPYGSDVWSLSEREVWAKGAYRKGPDGSSEDEEGMGNAGCNLQVYGSNPHSFPPSLTQVLSSAIS